MENKLTSVRLTGSEITTGINGSVIEDEDAIDGALEATAMEDGSGSLDSNMVLEEITTKVTLNTNFGLLEEKHVDEAITHEFLGLSPTIPTELEHKVSKDELDDHTTPPIVALDSTLDSSQCAAMKDVAEHTMFAEDVHDSISESSQRKK